MYPSRMLSSWQNGDGCYLQELGLLVQFLPCGKKIVSYETLTYINALDGSFHVEVYLLHFHPLKPQRRSNEKFSAFSFTPFIQNEELEKKNSIVLGQQHLVGTLHWHKEKQVFLSYTTSI